MYATGFTARSSSAPLPVASAAPPTTPAPTDRFVDGAHATVVVVVDFGVVVVVGLGFVVVVAFGVVVVVVVGHAPRVPPTGPRELELPFEDRELFPLED